MGKITKPIAFDLTLEVPCSGEGAWSSGSGSDHSSASTATPKRDEDGEDGSMSDAKHTAYGHFVKLNRLEAERKIGAGNNKKQVKKLLRSMWNDLNPQAQSKYEKMALAEQQGSSGRGSSGGNGSSSGGSKSNAGTDNGKSSKKMGGHGNGSASRNVQYDLTGVVVHHGGSIHSGHYVAFVKAPNGQWHEMNDSDVRLVNPQHVLKQQAYILFYTKRIPLPGNPSILRRQSMHCRCQSSHQYTLLVPYHLIPYHLITYHIPYHTPSNTPCCTPSNKPSCTPCCTFGHTVAIPAQLKAPPTVTPSSSSTNSVSINASAASSKINTTAGATISNGVSMLVVDQPVTNVILPGGDDGDMGERVTDPVILSKWQRAATSR